MTTDSCHGNATLCSFTLLWSYIKFCTALSANVHSYCCNMPDVFVRFKKKLDLFYTEFNVSNIIFNENPSSGSRINPLTLCRLTTYICLTAQLTSRRRFFNIYSTNTLTEYFKHAAHSPFFFLSSRCRLFHNAIFFGSCNIHILNTGCAKILKKIQAPKG